MGSSEKIPFLATWRQRQSQPLNCQTYFHPSQLTMDKENSPITIKFIEVNLFTLLLQNLFISIPLLGPFL
jgi:hypothetical protein